MSVGSTVAGGALEQVGVVITALDEFSINMQKYQMQLRAVQESEGQAAVSSRAAGQAAKEAGEAHQMSAMKMSKYAMAGLILSGSMHDLGIQTKALRLGMTLFFMTMTMGMSATTVLLLALGTLASVIIKAQSYAAAAKKEFAAVADITIKEAEATGIHTEQVRKAIEARKALILIEDAEIKSKILKIEADKSELGFMEAIVRGYRMIVEVIKGKTIAEANAIVETEAMQTRELKRLTTLAELNNTLAEHEKLLKSIATAERGGTEAIKAQEDHLKQLAEWEKLSAEYAEAAVRRKVKAWEKERDARDANIKQGREAESKALEAAVAQEKQAYADRTQAAIDWATETENIYKRKFEMVSQYILTASAAIGNAIGNIAQGSNATWRNVMGSIVRMAGQAFAQILMWAAAAHVALQQYGAAARDVAYAAMITAGAEAAAAAIERQGRSSGNAGSGASAGNGPNINVWQGSNGPGYQYNSSPSSNVQVTIQQNISGDMSPENAKAWETNAQKFLDKNMPKWMQRQRAVGVRFA